VTGGDGSAHAEQQQAGKRREDGKASRHESLLSSKIWTFNS
jgi:hypothetical protein